MVERAMAWRERGSGNAGHGGRARWQVVVGQAGPSGIVASRGGDLAVPVGRGSRTAGAANGELAGTRPEPAGRHPGGGAAPGRTGLDHGARGRRRWHWWQGLLFYVGTQVLSYVVAALLGGLGRRLGLRSEGSVTGDSRRFYREVRRPIFAPPAWAFPVAWTINNALAIWAGLRVLNRPAATPGRRAFLRLQAASWLDFVLFSGAAFSLRSPLNSLALTLTYLGLTLASLKVALRDLRDRAVAVALLPLLGWLALATALSWCIARWNRDELYRVGPFAKPDRRWLKRDR